MRKNFIMWLLGICYVVCIIFGLFFWFSGDKTSAIINFVISLMNLVNLCHIYTQTELQEIKTELQKIKTK